MNSWIFLACLSMMTSLIGIGGNDLQEQLQKVMHNQVLCIKGEKILIDGVFQEGKLWVHQGKIIAPQKIADYEIETGSTYVSPGFIDIQCNGALGVDFSKEPEKIEKVSEYLLKTGVTSFLPTIVSSKKESYQKSIATINQKKKKISGAHILGIHLEGPFICEKKRGMHSMAVLPKEKVNFKQLMECYSTLEGVKMLTLCPTKLEELELITQLKERGVIVSLGHTTAKGELLDEAVKRGCTHATHLYNAMLPIHHRENRTISRVLSDHTMSYGIILDGLHVNKSGIQLAWNANKEGFIPTTDCCSTLGLPDGEYWFGGRNIVVDGERCCVKGTDTLAGGMSPMNQCIKNLCAFTGCSLEEAIYSITVKPAKLLGVADKKGSLEIGMDADIIFFDDELNILSYFVDGGK